MTYLVDTHWLASFLNGRTRAVDLLTELSAEGISISIVTYGEIYEGFEDQPNAEARMAQFEAFLETIEVLTLDRAIAREYARLRSQLRSQGLLIPDNDLWIAATALAYDLTLATQDQHFQRLPDLKRL